MRSTNLLSVHDLQISTPSGRPLIRELRASLAYGERAAILGRNGVGKSTLLSVLAGETPPERGRVYCHGTRLLVPQRLPEATRRQASPGQARRQRLEEARQLRPDLLLLDEPTQDLDAGGIEWLMRWLANWKGALLVVSHEEVLLRAFSECLVVAESGCHHKSGDFSTIIAEIVRAKERREQSYLSQLQRQLEAERHQDRVRSRRTCKKNLGRLHELRRCTARAMLNAKRSYAQESQGKRSMLQRARIEASRAWVKSARRSLAVELHLELMLAPLPDNASPVICLSEVSVEREGRLLFENLTLDICRERIAITGPNGSGKSTLAEVLAGTRAPTSGRAQCDAQRVGYVAQAASNWDRTEPLIALLFQQGAVSNADAIAPLLRAHKFPFALAERPLASLSPGERLRAALICLCHRARAPEVLILDEPTQHLDFVGVAALRAALSAFRGGLVIVSHDAALLREVGATHHIELGEPHSYGRIQALPTWM